MKRIEINGGGWRWMKRMEMDEEYEGMKMMEMNG